MFKTDIFYCERSVLKMSPFIGSGEILFSPVYGVRY